MVDSKKSSFFVFLLLFYFLSGKTIFGNDLDIPTTAKIRNSVVKIDVTTYTSVLTQPSKYYGTGFIVDKKHKLIATNSHIASKFVMANYTITFSDGLQTQASLVYEDPWADIAILKVVDLSDTAQELVYTKSPIKNNDHVFMVGNPEGSMFSFHDGNITDIFHIDGNMPQGSYMISMNVAGGSSGSPVCNGKGEYVAIVYGGMKTYLIAANGLYLKNILDKLIVEEKPIRKHNGMIVAKYPVDKAVRHGRLPEEMAKYYRKKYPDSNGMIIMVVSTINNSPSFGLLKSGDILWSVEGKEAGPDLYTVEDKMNRSTNDSISLSVYRYGKKVELVTPLYDTNSMLPEKIIVFGGGVFFEADDRVAYTIGCKQKSLVNITASPGSSVDNMGIYPFYMDNGRHFRSVVTHIDTKEVNNIEDMISALKSLSSKQYITIDFINHQPRWSGFGNIVISSHESLSSDILLNPSDANQAQLFLFDDMQMDWIEKVPF